MGMFDTVRSSYPLISPESDRELQTKDLDCLMENYWISPAGQLYRIDLCAAFDREVVREELRERPWHFVQWVRNGRHGTLSACDHTALVTLYPAQPHQPWAEVQVLMDRGVIREVINGPR